MSALEPGNTLLQRCLQETEFVWSLHGPRWLVSTSRSLMRNCAHHKRAVSPTHVEKGPPPGRPPEPEPPDPEKLEPEPPPMPLPGVPDERRYTGGVWVGGTVPGGVGRLSGGTGFTLAEACTRTVRARTGAAAGRWQCRAQDIQVSMCCVDTKGLDHGDQGLEMHHTMLACCCVPSCCGCCMTKL
jgi:hypothetical protein